MYTEDTTEGLLSCHVYFLFHLSSENTLIFVSMGKEILLHYLFFVEMIFYDRHIPFVFMRNGMLMMICVCMHNFSVNVAELLLLYCCCCPDKKRNCLARNRCWQKWKNCSNKNSSDSVNYSKAKATHHPHIKYTYVAL